MRASQVSMDYSIFTLANGLRVVHSRMDSTAMVAVNILYDVGARDEDEACTGLAHLFEHLMFGGSANVSDFDGELSAAGGSSNAWTSADFTNFYDILPAHNIETAFHIESDRMLALSFDPHTLDVQKRVVVEEFKQTCLNQPYGDLSHHLMPMLYSMHPYRYPVIGKDPSHIDGVTIEYIRDFFYSHYAPNNAVLSVVGNVDRDTVCRLAEKWFASIPARDVKPHPQVEDTGPVADIEATVYGKVPNTLIVSAVRMGGYNSPLYTAADLITDLLAAGKSARFNQRLVLGSGLFTMAEACISGYEDSGWLMLQAVPATEDEVCIRECISALWTEARRLGLPGEVSQREMDRACNREEMDFMLSSMGYRQRAFMLAKAVLHGEAPDACLQRMRRCSPTDMEAAARLLLSKPHATLLYRPE